ncbi:MAG: hypothetical protein FJY85_13480 [Deltaproteobacteria bacterium]|nr:hypothetical protein [Deltaproteobacteria bacterium]
MYDEERRRQIAAALAEATSGPFGEAAIDLLGTLGYKSNRRLRARSDSPADFLALFAESKELNRQQALLDEWVTADFLFQFTGDEVAGARPQQRLFEGDTKWEKSRMESYLFVAIGLCRDSYTRTELASITRAMNRLFEMPVMLLFRHGSTVTLSVIDRRPGKRDPSTDVLEKVTQIKDIRVAAPHRAHIEILYDLCLDVLYEKHNFHDFNGLHSAWRATLDISELNKRFYKEIANWYFWALKHVQFPKDAPKTDGKDHVSIIRLITRLIFCWFIKEKDLIPDSLFERRVLERELVGFAPDSEDVPVLVENQ